MKNSGEEWRIYLDFTRVFAILWASDSSLQTVSIRGQVGKTIWNAGLLAGWTATFQLY
jgi:hypothetical protein